MHCKKRGALFSISTPLWVFISYIFQSSAIMTWELCLEKIGNLTDYKHTFVLNVKTDNFTLNSSSKVHFKWQQPDSARPNNIISPSQRSIRSKEGPSLKDTLELHWSDCGRRSRWLWPHIQYTFNTRNINTVHLQHRKHKYSTPSTTFNLGNIHVFCFGSTNFLCVCVCVLPADVIPQWFPGDERHAAWQWFISGQPIGVVVAWCVATGALGVAEQEGHGGKTR